MEKRLQAQQVRVRRERRGGGRGVVAGPERAERLHVHDARRLRAEVRELGPGRGLSVGSRRAAGLRDVQRCARHQQGPEVLRPRAGK